MVSRGRSIIRFNLLIKGRETRSQSVDTYRVPSIVCNGLFFLASNSIIYATADEVDAYMFYSMFFLFFLLFPFATKNTRQPFSGTAERIFMKLLQNDSGENGVCIAVPKLGLGPQLIFWGLKTTHCAIGGDA